METALQQILDQALKDPPRSRLEPFRELILRLRRQGWSYRGISRLLAEKCGVRATHSTLHEFIQRRSRPRDLQQQPEAEVTTPAIPEPPAPTRLAHRRSPEEIAALRAAASAANHKPVFQREEETRPLFVYDPDRPLTNKPSQKEK
jgi:hypothetical protein